MLALEAEGTYGDLRRNWLLVLLFDIATLFEPCLAWRYGVGYLDMMTRMHVLLVQHPTASECPSGKAS